MTKQLVIKRLKTMPVEYWRPSVAEPIRCAIEKLQYLHNENRRLRRKIKELKETK